MDVLVDTSVWSLALRRRASVLSQSEYTLQQELTDLIMEGRVVMIGPVRQEILSGLRDVATFERLRERLSAFDDVPLITDDYEEAARFHNLCRGAGIAGSAIDFLICAAASRRGLSIFTTDGDFQRYVPHLPVRLHTSRDVPG